MFGGDYEVSAVKTDWLAGGYAGGHPFHTFTCAPQGREDIVHTVHITLYLVISAAGLSSMCMCSPLAMDKSRVEVGTAAKKGTPWYLAAIASW